MGRWLVPGGTGFLPRALATAALTSGHEVVVAARGRTGRRGAGRAVVPGDLAQPAQIIDVRDLADRIVRSGEEHLVRTFHASGPRSRRGSGLRCRPLAETARAALEHERALGPDRPRKAGLTPPEESEVPTSLL
jgi:nucleoside-diphosphate-sugar epimerase